jgi:hypothetical protein
MALPNTNNGNSTHSLTLKAIEVVFKTTIEVHELRQQSNKGSSSIKIKSIYRNLEF